MTRNIDELNNLNTRAEEPEEYFKKMDLPEEEKERRVEYTKKANEIFDLILVLALLSDDKSPSFFASLRDRLETYLITLINEYTVPDDYLIDYASDTAFNFVDTTEKHIDDPWYTSEDRALFNAENGANDVLNYDLYLKAIADGKTHKKWITEKDNRVRKTHRPLDGKTIGIKELFYVGGIPMRFPKDYEYAEAFPEEIVGCRCTIKYLPNDKEEKVEKYTENQKIEINNIENTKFYAPMSVGAMANKFYVDNPNKTIADTELYIKPGTYVTGVKVIAAGKEIKDIKRLIRDYPLPNGELTKVEDWFKVRGRATLTDDLGNEINREIHWYQGKNIGKVEFKFPTNAKQK